MDEWNPETVTDDQFFDDFFEDELETELFIDTKKAAPVNDSSIPPKKSRKSILYWFLLLLAIPVLGINSYKLATWFKDRQNTKIQINEIMMDTGIGQLNIANATAATSLTTQNEKSDVYHQFLDKKWQDLSFSDLQKKNKDVVAWLEVPGTNINYPVVQSKDNSYYLNHSFNKQKNSAGWIYMDYRNSSDTLNQNTIIYGHSLWNKLMFGSLSELLKKQHYNNQINKNIWLITPEYQYRYQIVSVYTIKEELYYLTTDFTNEKYQTFLKTIEKRSKIKFKMPDNKFNSILTLSTCYDDEKRLVVHALLVGKNKR